MEFIRNMLCFLGTILKPKNQELIAKSFHHIVVLKDLLNEPY